MGESTALPGALIDHLRLTSRQAAIHEHTIEVRTGWWNNQESLRGGPVLATPLNGSEGISRADLFALADDAIGDSSGDKALTLLWHTLAWGTGTRHRNNKKRIRSVLAHHGGPPLLREAAVASRKDANVAFNMVRPGRRNAFPWFGPNFFTKYLYFASGHRR